MKIQKNIKICPSLDNHCECADCEKKHPQEQMVVYNTDLSGYLLCLNCELKRKAKEQKKFEQKAIEFFGLNAWLNFTLERYKKTSQNERAIELAKEFHPDGDNLYIFGKAGTGKSHLAYGIVRRFYPTTPSKIIKPPELFREFRKIDSHIEKEKIEGYVKIPILLIDDLGVGKATEFANQILYEIIDNRLLWDRCGLIITSNLTLDEFKDKCGDDRLASRLAGMCRLIELIGEDWRLKK